jgi:Undecaprenyl-phosphate glucose phosphotransferase
MVIRSPSPKLELTGRAPFASTPGSAGRLQPQQLGYVSLILDLGLFFGAGAASWWVAHVASADIYRLMALGITGMACIVFLGICRLLRVHDPLLLLQGTALSRLPRMIVCAGLPLLVPLVTSLLFIRSSETEVHRLISWLLWFELIDVAAMIAAHGFFQLVRPILSGRILARQRLAIIGSGESAARLIKWVELTAPGLFEIIGVFDDRDNRRTLGSSVAHQIRGSTADLIEVYKSAAIDKVVIALPHAAEARLLDILRRLRVLPVDIVLAPDLIGFNAAEQETAEMAGLKLHSLAHRPIRERQRLVKTGIDFAAAFSALVFLSPLLLAIAAIIRLDSAGPTFFRQRRQGLGDRPFEVYKFRTMYCELGDPKGANQTKRGDPRVTRIGAFLRKTSLDELPQIFNVLRGEMSLVGPRPHTPHMLIGDKKHYEIVSEYSFRHRVKPGITGLAQVNGHRGAVDTPDQLKARIDLDLYYIDHWSLWLDVKILYRTAFVCFSGRNAY